MLGLLADVNHQLLPERSPMVVLLREVVRLTEPRTIAFADPRAFERDERPWQHRTEFWQRLGDAMGFADGDHHQRHLGVPPEELRPLAQPRSEERRVGKE